jgi:hypothetical protein
MFRNAIATCALVLVHCSITTQTFSAEYLYHPQGPLRLGAGFDPIAVSDTKSDCLDHDGISPPQSVGATSTTFEISIVKSHQELLEKTQRDTSVAASYKFFSAGYSESSFNQYSFSKNSLTWVLRGFSTYGIVDLLRPRLKSEYAALDSDSLVRRCGREIITREIRGAQVALIYHLENLSESTVSRLERSFQAGASSGAFSASIKDKYQQFLTKAASVSKVSLNIDAIGGPGVSALSGLVTATDDMARVEAVVSQYLSQMSAHNAPSVRFFSATTLVSLAGRQDADSQRRTRQALIQLYNAELIVQSRLIQVQRALDPNGIYLKQLDSPTVERLSAAEKELKAANQKIFAAADQCIKSETCNVAEINVPRVDVSFLPKAPIVRWQRSDQNERQITLISAESVSEIHLRPTWITNIQGLADEPSFTRKIWSVDPDARAALAALAAKGGEELLLGKLGQDWRDFLYFTDRDTAKVVASGNTILITLRPSLFGKLGYMYMRGTAPPVDHGPHLIVTDRFGRTFTLDLRNPTTCSELQQCSMDDL